MRFVGSLRQLRPDPSSPERIGTDVQLGSAPAPSGPGGYLMGARDVTDALGITDIDTALIVELPRRVVATVDVQTVSRGVVDTGQECPCLKQTRIGPHPGLEVRTMPRYEQVHEFVKQDVVNDVRRHRREAITEPDCGVGRCARTPSSTLIADPADGSRSGAALEESSGQFGRAGVKFVIGSMGATIAGGESRDEILDEGHDLRARHSLRHDHDRATGLTVGRDAAATTGATTHLDAVGQPRDLHDALAHAQELSPRW